MTVHSKSVIPVWVKEFDNEFYNNLTRLENKLYSTNISSVPISLPLTTVSATNHHTNIAVSGNTLTANTLATTWKGAIPAVVPFGLGKWYWEFTINVIGDTNVMIGVVGIPPAVGVGNYLQPTGYMLNGPGTRYSNGVAGAAYGGGAFTNGLNWGVLLDTVADTITMYRNGVSQGVMYSGLTNASYYPAVDIYNAVGSVTVNFGATPFAYPVPAGANAYTTPIELSKNIGAMTPIVRALESWKESSRTSKFNEFAGVVYGFNKFADIYGLDKSILESGKLDKIFKFNNAPKVIHAVSDSYFTPSVSAGAAPVPSYTNIDSLATTISGAKVNDEVNMDTVKNNLISIIQNKTTSNILTLEDSATIFKSTLNWDTAFKELKFPGIDFPHTVL
jgi:hypothetical protein